MDTPPPADPAIHQVTGGQWARSFFIALLPVFAVFLGGSTTKWAEGIIVALLGAFLIVQPPRRSLGWATNVTFLAFALCASLTFLPHTWFFVPAWRTALTQDFAVELPNSVTPQPWLSAGALVSLIAGLCWLYRVSAQELELRVARFQLRLFAAGIVAIAALSMLLYFTQHALPFWQNARNFGPFPNRNQTADLFGITAVVILAAAQDDIRYRRMRWLLWGSALLVISAAIVLNFSRAGVLLLVVGCGLWVGIVALRIAASKRHRAAVSISLAASFLLLLLSALLLAGGQTLARFHLQKFAGADPTADFRWLIFEDTWRLIRSSPWTGIGLGNFESVFAIFRDASRANTRSLHPESDWLWLSAELGPFSVALVLLGGALLIRRVWPLEVGTNQRFRLAALIGALLFALHGLIDVSAHRVGTAYSAMFLLGLSRHRPTRLSMSKTTQWIFRIIGVPLLLIGLSWTVGTRMIALLPGGVGVASAKELAKIASRGRNFQETINLTTRALGWAPLDWELYYLRATAELAQRSREVALDDFRRARFLEPNSYSLPLEEGFLWLHVRPAVTAAVWREALQRAGRDRADVFRNIVFRATMRDSTARPILEQLALDQPDLALIFLAQLPAQEFQSHLNKFLQRDPDLHSLEPEQKRELFQLWQKNGDREALLRTVQEHADWLPFAWRAVADSQAAAGNFRPATELALKFGSEAALPSPESGKSTEQLQAEAYNGTSNFSAGYTLYHEQMSEGRVDDALVTIRHFTEHGTPPAYFYLLEAQAWAANKNWERSWNSWLKFEKAKAAIR